MVPAPTWLRALSSIIQDGPSGRFPVTKSLAHAVGTARSDVSATGATLTGVSSTLSPSITRTGPVIRKAPSRVMSSLEARSEEHTSELQSRGHLVCRLMLEKKTNIYIMSYQSEIGS